MRRKILFGVFTIFVIIVVLPAVVLLIYDKPRIRVTPIENPIMVYNHNTGELIEMDLEEYLIGVVAQEMPASFESEALKAQAIAARTYAYKRIIEPDARVKELHPQADITTNPNISQAWISNGEMREKWGFWNSISYRNKIANAVESTKGEVVVYQNKLIDPVYHSSCGGGKTENSEEVWKYPFPYLVSVQCPEHKEGYYQDSKIISLKSVDAALGTNLAKGSTTNSLKVLERSKAGRIKLISIDGKIIPGTELRTKLGLRSTWFTWEINKDHITFITRGYGHGVGMCQYGANHLAKEGQTYDQILKHYYRGVEIINIDSSM